MKLNKIVIVITGVAVVIITVFILILFFKEVTIKNSRYIDVISMNKNKIKYDVFNKKILMFSSHCEKCIAELKWLSQQSGDIQQRVDLISVSTYEETNGVIKKMHLLSNIYIDNSQEFEKKCNTTLTPSYFMFDRVDPVEVKGDLRNLIDTEYRRVRDVI